MAHAVVAPRIAEPMQGALPFLLRAPGSRVVARAIWKAPLATAERDNAHGLEGTCKASHGRSAVPAPKGRGRRGLASALLESEEPAEAAPDP
eukprot:11425184-Alexandrium_andersonii.AAC.1